MKTDDRFGDFLQFRRLGSTPLGSTFRAGRLQARAVDRVVLLQRFDGEAVDRQRLSADTAERGAVLERLAAPQFANGLALGTEDGVPYVAYDYLLGRTLQEALSRASQKSRPPATSYLLALLEQAAASLAAAAQTRIEGVPIRHGFLVPELLLLSAEGRVYPLGFSHGPALLRQEKLRELFAAYLAPEMRDAEIPIGDDVYSLAAILFEGLTGRPPKPGESTAQQVDQSLLTIAGTPIPPAVQDLLKSGLAPAGARPDLRTFHRNLRQVVDETENSPSQFQLAFFLHQLFRDELEAEAVEMRGEKTTRFDPLVLTPPEAEETDEVESEGDGPEAVPMAPALSIPLELELERPAAPIAPIPPPSNRSVLQRRPFLAGLALALALAVGTAGLFQLSRRAPAAAADQHGLAAATSRAADPEMNAELRRLVAERASDLQRKLEEEYEPRLSRLREEVLAAQARKRRRATPVAAAPAEPLSPTQETPDPLGGASSPLGEDLAPSEEAAGPEAAIEAPAAAVEPPEESAPAGELQPGPADGELVPDVAQPEPVPTEPPTEAATATPVDVAGGSPAEPQRGPAPEPAALPVRDAPIEAPVEPVAETAGAGESVDYSPPRLLTPPDPRYPAAAQRLRKTARVQVRVLVDAEGQVGETELLSEGVGFGFDKAAIEAASRTRWEPARRDGAVTTAWTVLTIDFRL